MPVRPRGSTRSSGQREKSSGTFKESNSEPLVLRQDLKLQEIGDFKPKRLELEWNIPDHDLDNVFFEYHCKSVVSNVKGLVETLFKCGTQPTQGSAWSMDTGDYNFCLESIIEQIARPDPLDPDPWDDLLKPEAKLFAVMRGVIMKVYTETMFLICSFGADKAQKKLLSTQSKAFLKDEGFRRSEVMAQTTRMFLGNSQGVPPFFWLEVDKLALRILLLILPVINWARRTWPPEEELIDIKTMYEHIHHCVAYAAWFSVNIKLSSSPFLFSWPSPGDRYMPDQVELCPALYSRSRLTNTERDFDETFQRAVDAPRGSQAPTPPPRRLARVMISAAPCVQIFRPVRDEESGEPIGQNVKTLTNAHVVYYHGLENNRDDEKLFMGISLVEHARALKPFSIRSIRERSRRVLA
ncbi:hypothetical protein CPLU01_07734 [Colletotrichum plurivorum]|uniref:Uncharacterized protein n=1 Tax=Colletotrichum plurivorum TaxID=2175906 RepID=A0A8H6KEY9_9PEZI|nr:hypothetical protein CPLU01_07734 [Colletotrichum plurivorum]